MTPWAVEGSGTFEKALVSAVSLGGDADSVGAVAGALAGAKWGASAIPKRWLEPLAWRNRIAATAMSLVRVSSEVHLGES
ncbi:ADP-ribosylglycohydrolase family protein [Lichenibacterium dinghuense]|uniref:ADP-ribosylglycohydrolase family protein n=1 Tax=Lichenibacterium dinghuense TaxID=2895977 RepID=UPI00210397BF|nr:ADP-ribosylglycohydrolase family protein [Lichenibacterium sp. 6Y81]